MPQAFVLGSPIAHSLSPALHTAAYAALGLTDWSYAAREVDQRGFRSLVASFGPQVRGLSLTMPLKEVAFEVATSVSERARLTGSINTLVRDGEGWAGHNTDVQGIVAALGAPSPDGSALLLGAGATARSALVALRELAVGHIVVAARDPRKAEASLGSVAAECGLAVEFAPLWEWPRHPAPLIVSTLAVAGGEMAAEYLAAAHPPAGLLAGSRLLDVVYAGWPTRLARVAEAVGADVIGGLEMLVHQAVEQVELMTGRRPPAEVLFTAAA